MINLKEIFVKKSATLRDALAQLNDSGIGLLLLLSDLQEFEQTITDGDLRRLLLDGYQLNDTLSILPQIDSVVINEETSKRTALTLMNKYGINHIPVLDESRKVVELLARKDIDEQILLSTPHIGDAEKIYVEEAFKTNWIAPLGPNVDAFEKEIADLVGVGHAAALSSGTAAIHLALILLDVKVGDRVFCSSFTFAASANPIIYQSAEPVFIDSDLASWNMSPKALKRAFETAESEGWMPRAVVVVNLYGQSADMDPIMEICEEYGVPIVEDAAESLGASYKNKASGTFGKIGIYSFNGNKIITTSGGGMLVSDDEELVEKARFLSTQARDPAPHYEHSEIGYNYRMSNILAGVGRGQLKVLGERVQARRNIFETYQDSLKDIDGISWMPEPDWSYSNRWLSTCLIDPSIAGVNSKELIASLADELIEARPLWKPMHRQPIFERYRYFTDGESSVSDWLFENGVCLPSGSNMDINQIKTVIRAVRKLVKNK